MNWLTDWWARFSGLPMPETGKDTMGFRLGKLDPKRLLTTPAFGDFLDKATTWPAVNPRGWEYAVPPDKLDILGNDTLGDCCVEGTAVSGEGIQAGYRASYSGPIVRIWTESGKNLAVTPKHAMLTPSGFALAKFIKKGDYLVGTRGAQPLPNLKLRRGELDFNKTPSPVEEVFSALRLRDRSPLKVVPSPVYFHGDGEFIDGNVDVVRAERLLRGELDSSLSQPNTQDEIRSAGKLERSFVRGGALRHASRRSRLAPHSGVGGSSDGGSFGKTHSVVAQAQGPRLGSQFVASSNNGLLKKSPSNAQFRAEIIYRLACQVASHPTGDDIFHSLGETQASHSLHRAKFDASFDHPSADGGVRTDADLVGNLSQRFPGLVEFDRVVKVEVDQFVGHIYDLSSESRWYVSDGIISHNCVIAAMMHYAQEETANTSNPLTPTRQLTVEVYSAVTGYDPKDPSTDQGTAWTDALAYWKKHGIPLLDKNGKEVIHQIFGWASLDLGSVAQQRYACDLFGGTLMGIQCPRSAEDDTSNWTYVPDSPIVGGHGINRAGQGGAGWHIGSWGLWIKGTWEFSLKLADEDYVVATESWINSETGQSPSGLDLNGLLAAMKAL
jgi:hypothetical protein